MNSTINQEKTIFYFLFQEEKSIIVTTINDITAGTINGFDVIVFLNSSIIILTSENIIIYKTL
jgi:hypothetical protein